MLASGCSTTPVEESLDPDVNYALKFSEMPLPRAEVVHSRVERERLVVLGHPSSPRNREWEFELIGTRSWIEVLKTNSLPLDWKDVELRSDLPAWFTPDPQKFTAFYFEGPSAVTLAQLFVETSPEHPDRVRVFVCRH